MRAYMLTHVSDVVLRRDLTALVVRDRAISAMLVAHLAEFDARGLFLAAIPFAVRSHRERATSPDRGSPSLASSHA
jgi:hypothetical protein